MPHLAVAVSGGADSLALATLARDWAARREGRVTGLVVDHGLREASAEEARHAALQLAALGIAPRVLRLAGLTRGPGLAARARAGRYDALRQACGTSGILHLLLGHHRADQTETVLMRRRAGSGSAGLAAMAALVETDETRLLRPLLDIPPGRLRATLRARGIDWIEDPSNRDIATPRARMREAFADPDGTGPAIEALFHEATRHGVTRSHAERRAAGWLARHSEIRPEGYALLGAGPWDPVATAALLRMLAGEGRPPPLASVESLAAAPRPATLGGVRVLPAGRWRLGGWLLVREEAALEPPVAASDLWDGRFRVTVDVPADMTLGALGDEAALFRGTLPTVVLRTLPTLRSGKKTAHVLHFSTGERFVHVPPGPAACAPFAPVQAGC